jgi:universal stress protein E
MSQYQRLFLIADPAMRHSPALQRAAALAQASGAALHIAAFVEPFPTLRLLDKSIQEQTRESYLKEHRDWLQDEAALLRSRGINVTVEAVWTTDTLREILLHVAEMRPDLLIKDVQHEALLKRAFVTPLDWHLLRESSAPVLLVGEAAHPLPRKVIAAVDPSRPEAGNAVLNEEIIQAANGLALQCDAELHLLHAYDLSPGYLSDPIAGTMGAAPNMVEELRAALHQSFVALAEHYGVPCERRHFIMGPPIKAIADFAAEQKADVMVMGTVQRKGLEKLIGSTTEYVLYQVPCSILAIKPGE